MEVMKIVQAELQFVASMDTVRKMDIKKGEVNLVVQVDKKEVKKSILRFLNKFLSRLKLFR